MAQKKYGSIQHIFKPYAELLADVTTVWLPGQFLVSTHSGGVLGLKCGNGVDIYSALGWFINPTLTMSEAPFKVRNTDPWYFSDGTDVVITRDILQGREDYPVNTTQNNVAGLRDDQISFDADAGSFTLLGMGELNDGEIIQVYPNWVTSAPGGLAADIAALTIIAAPFLAGGAYLPWGKPANEIPTGWRECVLFAGKNMIGVDVTNPLFDTVLKLGGANTMSLEAKHNGPHTHLYRKPDGNTSHPGGSSGFARPNGATDGQPTGSSGTGEPFSLLSEFRTVNFIELDI